MNRNELKTHILSSIDKIAEEITQNRTLNGDEGIRAICSQVQKLCEKHLGNEVYIEVTLSRAIGAYHNPVHFGVLPISLTSEQRTLCAVHYIKREIEKAFT